VDEGATRGGKGRVKRGVSGRRLGAWVGGGCVGVGGGSGGDNVHGSGNAVAKETLGGGRPLILLVSVELQAFWKNISTIKVKKPFGGLVP